MVDPSGVIVAAAQNADLLYLQHVVALHHPIRGGRITSPPTRPPESAPGGPGPRRHARVHRDVYLFFKCADPAADGGAS